MSRKERDARIIDLSMAIEDHFRWQVEHQKSNHASGNPFQVTGLGWPVQRFTGMDGGCGRASGSRQLEERGP
jgi:hypothetical protein